MDQRSDGGMSRRFARVLACASALLLVVCGDPLGPRGAGDPLRASLAFAPTFPVGAAAALSAASVNVDNVHIVLRRADGSVVLDTIVAFPAGVDEIKFDAAVQLRGVSEMFVALIQLRSGTVVLFEGTQNIEARAGLATAQTVAIATKYAGPGANATRVSISPRSLPLMGGTSAQLVAAVLDAGGVEVPGVPLVWTTSDATIATVSPTGMVTALAKRGAANVKVQLLSGLSDIIAATVALPPAAVRASSGAGQSAAAGSTLPQPLLVQVEAADGVPVAGVNVTFRAVAVGAAVSPATAVTDAGGRASTSMTLGSAVGPQIFEAVAGSFAAASITATATPGAAAQIVVVSGNAQSDSAGKPLAQPFVVRVSDKFGNPVSGVQVGWQRTSGGGALAGASSTTDAAGQATMTYTLGAPRTEAVTATIAAGGSVTFTATSLARPPTSLVATTAQSFSGSVGSTVAPALGVLVMDALGYPVPNAPVQWSASGGSTIVSPTSVTAADGRATMTATFATQPGSSRVTASIGGTTAVHFDLVAQTGPASQIQVVAGAGQSANAGAPLPISPAVRVLDVYGNPVTAAVTFTVAAGGGSITGSPAPTDATGLATAGTWTLGSAGPQTLTASVGSLTATISATLTAVTTPLLAIAQQPNASQSNAQPFSAVPQVQLTAASGAPVSQAGVPVTVTLLSSGQTLGGTQTVNTNASGLAVFNGLSITGTAGANQLQFSSPGYTGVTSSSFTVTPGVPVQIAAVTAQAFTGTAGSVASPTPEVRLTDVSGNPVPSQTVTFAPVNAASGVVTGGAAVTNALGIASPTSWTLSAVAGKDTLHATFGSVAGSPVVFEVVTTSGTATQLVLISGDQQVGVTGQPLAAPMIVEARDALGNPVASVNVTWTVTAGGGTPTSQTTATSASGRASFTLTLGGSGTQGVSACLAGCAAPVAFSALAIPVGADATWNGNTSTSWSTAANWSPAVVPTASSNVFIPSGRPNSPVLSGAQTVNDMTLAGGATLNSAAFQLDVTGNLLAANAAITGSGVVRMTGTGKQLAGTIPSLLLSSGSVTATGTMTIAGSMVVTGGAVFDAGAVTTTVTGSLNYVNGSGARLRMNNPSGHLIIGGDAYFNAADMGDVDLTAGTLEVKGNFMAQSGYFQAFRAAGTHLTKFSGTAAQNVFFFYAADNHSRFQNVEFGNSAGVSLNTVAVAAGSANVTGTTALTGARLNVAGLLTSAAGTSLAGLSDLLVYQTGSTFPQIAGIGPPMVYLASGGTITLPAGTTALPTSLTVTSGTTLDIGASTLLVPGALTYANGSGARLRMNNSAARLVVGGAAYFNAADMGDADLTAGTLEVKGNFTAESGYLQAFRAAGTHLTRFNGTGAQTVFFFYPADNHSRFRNVEFANASGVAFANQVVASGTASIIGATPVTGARFNVGGLLTSAAGTSLAGLSDMLVYQPGATFPQIVGIGPPVVYLASGGTITLPGGTTLLPTSLTVMSGTTLDVGTSTLQLTGSLTYANGSGARLRMNNPAAVVRVGGDAYFNAADMGDADLTGGVLEVRGNFTAQSGYFQAFRAAGSHVTRFTGTAPQSIFFFYPADNHSRFQNAEFATGTSVNLANGMVASGNVAVTGTASLSGARLNVAGLLTTTSGSSLASLSDVLVYAPGATFPQIAGSAPPMVYLASGGTITLPPGATALPGPLTVTSGTTLDIGASTLSIAGSLTYANGSGARLKMTTAAARLIVSGDAYFNAADMGDADLTAGTLEIAGNFRAESGYFQSFRSSGAHLTKFVGSAAQSIYFFYPALAQSLFANVEVANSSASGVSLASNVFASSLAQGGRLTVPSALSISGALTLGPASITNVQGSLTKGSCSAAPGAAYTGFTCP